MGLGRSGCCLTHCERRCTQLFVDIAGEPALVPLPLCDDVEELTIVGACQLTDVGIKVEGVCRHLPAKSTFGFIPRRAATDAFSDSVLLAIALDRSSLFD